jgi:hypothetical protein
METEVRAEQWTKQQAPKDVTDDGMVIDVRYLQREKQ